MQENGEQYVEASVCYINIPTDHRLKRFEEDQIRRKSL